MPEMRLELGPAAGAPDDADIPDQPACIVSDDTRGCGISDEASVCVDHRIAIRITQGIPARHLAGGIDAWSQFVDPSVLRY